MGRELVSLPLLFSLGNRVLLPQIELERFMFKPPKLGACLILIVLILLSFSSVVGQGSRPRSLPTTVHGQVRYAHGGAPVDNVLVRLERFSGGIEGEAITDRTGKFQFSGVPPAVYLVKV